MASSFHFNLQSLMNQAHANAEGARKDAEDKAEDKATNLTKMLEEMKRNFGQVGKNTAALGNAQQQQEEAENLFNGVLRSISDDLEAP